MFFLKCKKLKKSLFTKVRDDDATKLQNLSEIPISTQMPFPTDGPIQRTFRGDRANRARSLGQNQHHWATPRFAPQVYSHPVEQGQIAQWAIELT